MDIASFEASPNADALVRDIARYELADHVVELDAYGFTVIPPEKLQVPDGFIDRLRGALLRTHEQRAGVSLGDYRTAESIGIPLDGNVPWWWLLEEDDSVVEAALNPVVLTMARWLCGQNALLSATAMLLKAPIDPPSAGLHNDTFAVPSPLVEFAHSINTSWILSDYEAPEDGPTLLVPGSHRFGRVPQPYEAGGPPEGATWKMVPLQAKAGSLAIWHGNTWHGGGAARKKPGLRVTLVLYWARAYMRPLHEWRGHVSEDVVERFPELKRVLGLDHPYPVQGHRRSSTEAGLAYRDLSQDQYA